MWNLLRRLRAGRDGRGPGAPTLEVLERRDCPSAVPQNVLADLARVEAAQSLVTHDYVAGAPLPRVAVEFAALQAAEGQFIADAQVALNAPALQVQAATLRFQAAGSLFALDLGLGNLAAAKLAGDAEVQAFAGVVQSLTTPAANQNQLSADVSATATAISAEHAALLSRNLPALDAALQQEFAGLYRVTQDLFGGTAPVT